MFGLEKLQLKHSSFSKKSIVMPRCQEVRFLSGTGGLEREERMLMTTQVAKGQQQAEQVKMLSV